MRKNIIYITVYLNRIFFVSRVLPVKSERPTLYITLSFFVIKSDIFGIPRLRTMTETMSSMAKMVKSMYPDKVLPSNFGERWTTDEENLLLDELEKNIEVNEIAKSHNRTIGGIRGRQQTIAYEMHRDGRTEEDIERITKISIEQLHEIIAKKEAKTKKKKETIESDTSVVLSTLEEMKKEIKDLKNTVKELVEMMKAVYVFEDAS